MPCAFYRQWPPRIISRKISPRFFGVSACLVSDCYPLPLPPPLPTEHGQVCDCPQVESGHGRSVDGRSGGGSTVGRRSVDGPSTVRRRSVHSRAVDEGRSVGPRTVDVLSTVGTRSVDDRSVGRSMVGPRSVGGRSTVGPRSVHGRSPISRSVDGRCTVSRRSADGRPWFGPRSDVGVGVGVAGS